MSLNQTLNHRLWILALLAGCGSAGTVDPNLRPLTATEVSRLVGLASAEVAPKAVESLRTLEASHAFEDATVDFMALPPGHEITRAINELADKILDERFIESQTATEITYRANDELCKQGSGQIDQSCHELLANHPIRVIATSVAPDEVRLALVLGQRRIKPVVLTAAADHASLDVDLAAVRETIIEYRSQIGIEPSAVPSEASGLLRLEITAHTGKMSVPNALRLVGVADGHPYLLDLGASSFEIDLDRTAQHAVGELSLGAFAVDVPLGLFARDTTCTTTPEGFQDCQSILRPGTISFRGPGLHTSFNADATMDQLLLADLGFGGPVTIAYEGATQISFDMNAARGHQVDVSFRYLRQELEIALSPSLEAAMDFTMSGLAAVVEIPHGLLDESLRLRFDGATQPTARIGSGVSTQLDVLGRVVSGQFLLSSNKTGGMISLGVDECVGLRDQAPADAALLDALISYACE